MYFEDLSSYCYLKRRPNKKTLNIGWLDSQHPFPTGTIPDEVLKRVLALCFTPVNQTLGYHASPFLRQASFGYPVEFNGKKTLLGSAEIRVPGKDGKVYAAPNLIYHYMKDCGYLPPQEFLEAVEAFKPRRYLKAKRPTELRRALSRELVFAVLEDLEIRREQVVLLFWENFELDNEMAEILKELFEMKFPAGTTNLARDFRRHNLNKHTFKELFDFDEQMKPKSDAKAFYLSPPGFSSDLSHAMISVITELEPLVGIEVCYLYARKEFKWVQLTELFRRHHL